MDLFKKVKIEVWVLCLAGVLLFTGFVGFGSLVRHEILQPVSRFPILSKTALFLAEIPSNLKIIFRGQSFDLINKGQHLLDVSGFKGRTLEDETYMLLSRYDGDAERSIVELIDLRSFEVKKTWRPDINKINDLVDTSLPEFKHLDRDHNSKRYLISHPFLTTDGGIIFKDNSQLVKVDKNSQYVWHNQDDVFHHSIEQDHEGNFWVPSHVYPYQVNKKYVGMEFGNYFDDALTKVSADGKILYQKSVSNILIENNLKFLLFAMRSDRFLQDPIHLNDIQPVLTDGQYWKRGDVFLSIRNQSMVILYRPSTNKIIWQGTGYTAAQHDIDILDENRISIFNNNAIHSFDGEKVDGNSEVVIYDFETDTYSKYLDLSLKQYDAKAKTGGQNQILDNGDLYFRDSHKLLYFDKDALLRWQYVNRADNGKVYLTAWSRILYKSEDIKKINKILETEN